MAYKVIILYQLYMPSYFLGTFTEYPYIINLKSIRLHSHKKFRWKIFIQLYQHIFHTYM